MTQPIRYRLYSDDDGHTYCVPADAYDYLEKLDEKASDGDEDAESQLIDELDKYAGIEGGELTFQNPIYEGELIQ